jgi:hypothetical protein
MRLQSSARHTTPMMVVVLFAGAAAAQPWVRAAGRAEDFSDRIREGLPGVSHGMR